MTTYDDRPVKWMLYPSILFMVFTMAVGVYLAFNSFVFPDFFAGQYVQFGRIRPVHVNGVLLLWLLSGTASLIYYFVPRLCGIPLWSTKLAGWTAILWWGSLCLGVFSYPLGTNYGWEYNELPLFVGGLPVKWIFILSWALFCFNIFATIAKRKHKKMYVSLWYTMGTLIWTTFNVGFVGGFSLEILPFGISRVNASLFYVHNIVGLTFTPFGVAAAYYFIPKISNVPLYSHKLSMIGFWSIAFVYAWIGAHHIIHGPMSQWLQTVSIIFSIWLFIPVWTVITNFFATLKGHWEKYTQSAPIRFLMMGTVFYLLTCIQGPVQSLRNVNEITSKTDWVVGHAHMAVFGAFTFFAVAGIYHVVPVITNKPLRSKVLADWHFTLWLIGGMLFFVSLWVGGFLQGLSWANWANGDSYAAFHRNLSEVPFLQTIADMWWWWLFRAIGGALILLGSIVFAINIFNTVVLKAREENVSANNQAVEASS